MNDFDYDAMQKKRIARGAQHKRCGSKSKKCSLPSDNLTPAQKRALNGEVKQYNLNEPMTWEAFKAMPQDLQEKYVRDLHSRFNVGATTISREMFGLSECTLHVYAKHTGFNLATRTCRLSNSQRDVWERWLNREPELIEEEASEPTEEMIEEMTEDDSKTVAEPATFGIGAFHVEWCGEFDAAAFMAQLSKLPIPSGRVKIRLEVARE